MSLNYKLVTLDDDRFLTVYVSGEAPLLASSDTHTNFDELVRLAQQGDESVVELFDTGKAIQKAFNDVVEGRVAVRAGIVYFDDDAMDNAITEAILRVHNEGLPLGPLVKFMENVMANPQVESREQFYRWLDHHQFPIDEDGNIIAYKGVKKDDKGVYRSLHAGHAFVNGVEFKHDYIPNAVGDIVTMPRTEVDFDPNSACSTGLHAGTHEYAVSYARNGALMYVKINPRDVVSVPHDSASQKVRVCRYEVIDFADTAKKHESAYWTKGVAALRKEEEQAAADAKAKADAEAKAAKVVTWVDASKHEQLPAGTKVRVKPNPVSGEGREAARIGGEFTVKYGVRGYVSPNETTEGYVSLNETNESGGVWNRELEKAVTGGKRDTRDNHKFQPRDANGHFIKRASSKTV